MVKPESENIRKNIILPFVIIITILTLLFVFSANWLQEKHLKESTQLIAEQYSDSFRNAVQKDAELLIGLVHLLSRDQKLLMLWQNQDREALYQYAAPFFELFGKNHHITHFYFHKVDQHVFLRTHKKEAFGDKVERHTLVQAVKSQADSIGLEMGTVGLFVLRAVSPIFYENRLLGYLELGKEVDDVSHSLSASLGIDLVFIVNKTFIEKSQYEEYVRNNSLPDLWSSFAYQVMVSSTIKNAKNIVEQASALNTGNSNIMEIAEGDLKFHAIWKDLTDASNETVGKVLVLHDTTQQKKEISQLWMMLLLLAVAITLLISFFYYQYVSRLEAKLSGLIKQLNKEVEGHRSAQQQLKQSNRRLHELNTELESYSYSLAHDLRAPLRAVTSFSEILASDAGPKLNEEEHNFLQRIVAAGRHMAELIQDILQLANVAREDLQIESVDLAVLAQNTLQLLQSNHPEKAVEISLGTNLICNGSRVLLGLLLDNLIGNAWKYTGQQTIAKIELNAIEQEGRTVFYVSDNGIGMDKQYSEKIFKPFHRLPNAKTFEGTGIGLAICKRIIDRHDGDIWVKSELNKGATVYFTIGENTFTT